MGPTSKHEIHLLHIQKSLKVMLCNIFNNFVNEIKFYGMEFSTCGILSAHFRFGAFWILNVQIRDAQFVKMALCYSLCHISELENETHLRVLFIKVNNGKK